MNGIHFYAQSNVKIHKHVPMLNANVKFHLATLSLSFKIIDHIHNRPFVDTNGEDHVLILIIDYVKQTLRFQMVSRDFVAFHLLCYQSAAYISSHHLNMTVSMANYSHLFIIFQLAEDSQARVFSFGNTQVTRYLSGCVSYVFADQIKMRSRFKWVPWNRLGAI